MMFIESKYGIGDKVYLITDAEQCQRMIIKILIHPIGVQYCLGYGATETWHYEIELSDEKVLVV